MQSKRLTVMIALALVLALGLATRAIAARGPIEVIGGGAIDHWPLHPCDGTATPLPTSTPYHRGETLSEPPARASLPSVPGTRRLPPPHASALPDRVADLGPDQSALPNLGRGDADTDLGGRSDDAVPNLGRGDADADLGGRSNDAVPNLGRGDADTRRSELANADVRQSELADADSGRPELADADASAIDGRDLDANTG